MLPDCHWQRRPWVTREEACNAVRKKDGSPFYFFDYTDKVTGRRIRKRTRITNKEEAVSELLSMANGTAKDGSKFTLLELLTLFSSVSTNPKYIEAKSDGTNYGYSHADHVAKASTEIIKILEKDARYLLSKKISQITIVDVKCIKDCIVKRMGRRRKSEAAFSNVKTMFSYANSSGWINMNPAAPVGNIKYEKVERVAVDILIIRKAFLLKANRILDEEELAFFLVVATTGMRRGEAMALSTVQIKNGILNIRRNVKKGEEGNTSIGLPKWDNTREIPLPQVTKDVLARLKPRNGRYFPYSYSWADEAIKHVTASICAAFTEDADEAMEITCHVLRHSLNTALKLIGCPEIMLDQWFGWSEGRKTMQSRYTHIYAKNLKPIANTIDFLFSERFTGFMPDDNSDASALNYFDNRPVKAVITGQSALWQEKSGSDGHCPGELSHA